MERTKPKSGSKKSRRITDIYAYAGAGVPDFYFLRDKIIKKLNFEIPCFGRAYISGGQVCAFRSQRSADEIMNTNGYIGMGFVSLNCNVSIGIIANEYTGRLQDCQPTLDGRGALVHIGDVENKLFISSIMRSRYKESNNPESALQFIHTFGTYHLSDKIVGKYAILYLSLIHI